MDLIEKLKEIAEKDGGLWSVAKLVGTIKDARTQLEDAVKSFQEDRLKLFHERLRARNQEWCSLGGHPVGAGATKLVVTSSGYRQGPPYCDYVSHEAVHSSCDACRLKALEGLSETNDSHYRVTLVRKVDGKILRANSGQGVWLSKRTPDHSEPKEVPHGAEKALDMPPKIRIFNDCLVIESEGQKEMYIKL